MNNTSMRTTDQLTHVKIVVVSLVLGTVVVGIGIAARPTAPDMSTQLEARAPAAISKWIVHMSVKNRRIA